MADAARLPSGCLLAYSSAQRVYYIVDACTNISSGRWWITQLCEWDYYYSRQWKLTLNSIGIVVRDLLDARIPAVKVCGSGNSCLSSWLISQVSAHSNYSFDILQIALQIIQKTLPVLARSPSAAVELLKSVPAECPSSSRPVHYWWEFSIKTWLSFWILKTKSFIEPELAMKNSTV